jgi:hypothetical protein
MKGVFIVGGSGGLISAEDYNKIRSIWPADVSAIFVYAADQGEQKANLVDC